MSARRPNTGPPLVAHVIFALRMGGLENGLVNIINRTPPDRYRHAVVCLTDHDDFASRISRDDVEIVDLGKRPGHDLRMYRRLWSALRALGPSAVHTRNFVALDAQAVAAALGVRARVHGEHGRDVFDLELDNLRQLRVRRALRGLVHRYVALSADLEDYLVEKVRVPASRVERICNGVDTARFTPLAGAPPGWSARCGFPGDAIVLGTVGRMETVKDPLNLVDAFATLHAGASAQVRERLRLVMIGDGSLAEAVRTRLRGHGLDGQAWLPGPRDDVPELLRALDVFVLPSRAEGISNTILEAMASGVPVLATRVGGNPELITEGETGCTVPAADSGALAAAIAPYARDPALRRATGAAGRRRAESSFSIDAMVERYLGLYDDLLGRQVMAS